MTQLQTRNQNTSAQIESLNNQLADMQKMIAQMQSEMRVLNQQHKAQETLTKEWANTQKMIIKQFKDACSVYGSPDAIDDMLSDLQEAGEEIKANFEDYAVSDRFLNQETAEVEDNEIDNIISLLPQSLPDEDDNTTVLTANQIEQVLSSVSEETIKQVRNTFNISAKVTKLSSIASALVKHNLTHSKLKRLVQYIEGQQLLLTGNM